MKIKELAQTTHLTKGELIFLRKENLLRQQEDYDEYAPYIVNKIRLMRKLNVKHRDILWMQKGLLALNQCLSVHIQQLQAQNKEYTRRWIELAREIQAEDVSYNLLDATSYLEKIQGLEARGEKFASLKGDCWTRLKGSVPQSSQRWFEPDEPILTRRDFTNELIKYAEQKGEELVILKEGLEPIVELNGEQYLCMLESPRMLKFPFSVFFATRFSFGFKFVYMYRYLG